MAVSGITREHFEQQIRTLDRARYVAHRLIRDYRIFAFRLWEVPFYFKTADVVLLKINLWFASALKTEETDYFCF